MGEVKQLMMLEGTGMIFETFPRGRAVIIVRAGLGYLGAIRQNGRVAFRARPHDGDVARPRGVGIFAGDDDKLASIRKLLGKQR